MENVLAIQTSKHYLFSINYTYFFPKKSKRVAEEKLFESFRNSSTLEYNKDNSGNQRYC